MKTLLKENWVLIISLLFIFFIQVDKLCGQENHIIRGLIEDENKYPVPFATVALLRQPDSTLISGTISDSIGRFELKHNMSGDFLLSIRFMGYKPLTKKISLQSQHSLHLGALVLHASKIEIAEATVLTEPVKAKKNLNKTTYYVNKKMKHVSSTGIDMVKLVPGIQVDLFQNLSLEGNSNILIQVNGMNRSSDFLNQLNSDDIDKIEITHNPGVNYNSEISGIINIVLKKNQSKGVKGHLYTEIPVQLTEVYSFPSANISYTFNNLNIYSSYKGELSYFDIEAENVKNILIPNYSSEIIKNQYIKQKNQAHKFNFGFDYFFNKRSQLNFHGFLNHYSNEHDGTVVLTEILDNKPVNTMHFDKDDRDKNRSALASIYFKHAFNDPEKEFTLDLNYYSFNAENITVLSNMNGNDELINSIQPINTSYETRLNFKFPIGNKLKTETGVEGRLKNLGNNGQRSFRYREMVSSAYANVSYSREKIQIEGGVRGELAKLRSVEWDNKTIPSGLYSFTFKYDLLKNSNLSLTSRKTIKRPHVYQLNPYLRPLDPYTSQKGNLEIRPSKTQHISLDYSNLIHNNFLSCGVFYTFSNHVIEDLTVLDDSLHFKSTTENLGNVSYAGVNIKGSLKASNNISFTPFLKFFQVQTKPNAIARRNGIEKKNSFAMQSGASVVVLFEKDIALSVLFKYNSRINRIQGNYFEDVLYFVSLEKSFFEKFKFGITSAVPLKKEFTYQGYESGATGFNEFSEDNIKLSLIPIWFKIKYSFDSGKNRKRINSAHQYKETILKKGF